MHKTFYFLILFALTSFYAHSQKLTGDVIGSSMSFDYGYNICSTTINTPENIFDGNLNTFLAGCDRNNVWAGLDLGEPHVITEIAYCPRVNMQHRLILGVFEGANNPDFGDAIPIFVITERPENNKLTKKSVNCSRAFRYVRYVGPNDTRGNIAEVEFYGYKSAGDDSQLYQVTNLPSIIIHTENAQDVVIKDLYLNGIISVISESGTLVYSDSLEIKGRGNASWNFPKKPYRLKLKNKTNLLGLPAKEKNWTLINNYGDKTLMRNLLAFDLSKRLEMPYTPAGKPVDVFLNGEYKGTYQLCDQIEVATNRVPIEKMAETTSTLPDLSGGYLLEMDAYADQEISWFKSQRNQIPVTIKYPKDDEITTVQRDYIVNYFNQMESAFFGYNYTNPTEGFRKYIDTETFLRHFLVGEISGNTDTYWSVYMYKFKNSTSDPTKDKFYFGPVWDFDIAYENDNRTFPINTLTDWVYNTKGSTAAGVKSWVNRIFSDAEINADLKRIYGEYRDNNTISETSLLSVADFYRNEMNQSQQLNFIRWPILNSLVHQNFRALGNYQAEVDSMKSFIKNRIKWIDQKLGYIPSSTRSTISPNIQYWTESGTFFIKGFEINSSVMIYDVYGRNLINKRAENVFSTQLDKGVYLIHVLEKSGSESIIKCMIP